MRFDGRDQKIRVAGSLIVDLIVGHDLVLRFLDLHYFPKFVGFAGLALANDLR